MSKSTNEVGIKMSLLLGVIFLLILVVFTINKNLPIWVIGWYVLINFATYLLYYQDKNAAKTQQWRIQESTLHKLALLGGWVGASVAQKLLRHKSQKIEFRKIYYLTIIGNWLFLVILWYFNYR